MPSAGKWGDANYKLLLVRLIILHQFLFSIPFLLLDSHWYGLETGLGLNSSKVWRVFHASNQRFCASVRSCIGNKAACHPIDQLYWSLLARFTFPTRISWARSLRKYLVLMFTCLERTRISVGRQGLRPGNGECDSVFVKSKSIQPQCMEFA